MKIKMSISSTTLFTKFWNTAHKSNRLSFSHLTYEVKVKCSLIQRTVNICPLLTPNIYHLGLRPILVKTADECHVADTPWSPDSWQGAWKIVGLAYHICELWDHGDPVISRGLKGILVSWLHIAARSLDRCSAMTLSQRGDRVWGRNRLCKFLHTPGEKDQSKGAGAWPSRVKGGRL